MGDHSKPRVAPLTWARAHKRTVLAVAAGAVAVVSALVPDFPGHAVLTALGSVLA